MSLIREFLIAAENFRLGQVLSGLGAMQFKLEHIVPTGHMVMLIIWATGGAHETFEKNVRKDPGQDCRVG